MHGPKIMFYVQYLLGIGHVRRSSLIVKALCQQGAQVHVIFGGSPVPSMSFGSAKMHFLPAVRSSDAAFSGLVNADGSVVTQIQKEARSSQLLDICERVQPDLIVTETFPFGRRQMRFELQPLLNWVKQQSKPPILVASIRDILQKRRAIREQECLEIVAGHYQKILVHGDEHFFPLANSFEHVQQIEAKLHYTGYACPELTDQQKSAPKSKKIVVSVGSGMIGKNIIECALALYHSGFAKDYEWLLITGPNMPEPLKQSFIAQSQDNLSVVDLADDFLAELVGAAVSVSRAGYNTVMDLLQTKTPAVLIPFEGVSETEQLMRAQILSQHGVLQQVKDSKLTPKNLAAAIERALSNERGDVEIDSNGANNSAALLIEWATLPKK
jgi:predicted glycosyltransferase